MGTAPAISPPEASRCSGGGGGGSPAMPPPPSGCACCCCPCLPCCFCCCCCCCAPCCCACCAPPPSAAAPSTARVPSRTSSSFCSTAFSASRSCTHTGGKLVLLIALLYVLLFCVSSLSFHLLHPAAAALGAARAQSWREGGARSRVTSLHVAAPASRKPLLSSHAVPRCAMPRHAVPRRRAHLLLRAGALQRRRRLCMLLQQRLLLSLWIEVEEVQSRWPGGMQGERAALCLGRPRQSG